MKTKLYLFHLKMRELREKKDKLKDIVFRFAI